VVKLFSSASMLRFRTLLLFALVVCCLSTGCVRRRLTVRTNPPGAQVFVDDQEIGTTPCSSSFVYYGTRKVTLIKDGYRTETLYQKLSAPWYQIPPLDFASENLSIREIRDERVVDVQMVPQEMFPRRNCGNGRICLRKDGRRSRCRQRGRQPARLACRASGLPGGEPIPRYPPPAPPAAFATDATAAE
jgi:hypothetical protein